MRLRLPAPGVIAAVTLLVLVGGLAFTVWWPYRGEQAVIERLSAAGNVDVDYEYVGPAALASHSDSEWLNWFRRVRRLRLSGQQSGGPMEVLPSLTPLRNCNAVEVTRCNMDEENVRRIAACPRLLSLKLVNCEVEPGALHGLDGHNHLWDVEMVSCRVVGDVLQLPAAPRLVSFRGNFNSSLRVLDVSAVPHLLLVEVKNCAFDDEGVARLLDAPGLQVLRMPRIPITDAAIDDLLQLESLRFVDLRLNGQLSPHQIGRLAELPRLRTVAVWYAVTDEEFNELQTVLPQATLDRRP